jgi:hypothetical protein
MLIAAADRLPAVASALGPETFGIGRFEKLIESLAEPSIEFCP